MSEMYHFEVHKAYAKLEGKGLTVRLHYPRNPTPTQKRLPENPSWGLEVMRNLTGKNYSEIASTHHPIKPASAGAAYLFEDGKFVCTRRDEKAPGHPLGHSIYLGYTQNREQVYTAEGLLETALRESAEECLLVTRERKPWLIVPNDSKEYTLESARRIGVDLEKVKPRYINVEMVEPTDTLEVYYEDGEHIFTTMTFLEFIYESQTSLNAIWIRKFPLSSEEILPIDAEGVMKDGKFVRFNRESYILHPSEVELKPFGSALEKPEVYQAQIREDGTPFVYTRAYTKPYLGPYTLEEVAHPHIWAPGASLERVLQALQVPGYDWIVGEAKRCEKKLRCEDD